MISGIVGFVIGLFFGMIATCLVVAGSDADKRMDEIKSKEV